MKNNKITVAMISISLFVCLISLLGTHIDNIHYLFFSDYNRGAPEILHGQVWRLFTPMFIHFGVLHILFNSMAMWQLGKLIEDNHSRKLYIVMILVMGGISNYVQYLFAGPAFGGLSGLLYGLFGYIWIYGWRNPSISFKLPKNAIIIMLVWFGLCWTGLLGNVANWCHTSGLISGMVWAYIATINSISRSYNDDYVSKNLDL